MPRKTTPKAALPAAVYASALTIRGLTASVHLGAGGIERSGKQNVVVDVRLYLPALLSSASDDHDEYLCYHSLSEKIHALCTKKPYRLIEFLTMEIYRLLRKEVPKNVKITVRLSKPRILLEYVQGGTSYSYNDLPPGAQVVPEPW